MVVVFDRRQLIDQLLICFGLGLLEEDFTLEILQFLLQDILVVDF